MLLYIYYLLIEREASRIWGIYVVDMVTRSFGMILHMETLEFHRESVENT